MEKVTISGKEYTIREPKTMRARGIATIFHDAFRGKLNAYHNFYKSTDFENCNIENFTAAIEKHEADVSLAFRSFCENALIEQIDFEYWDMDQEEAGKFVESFFGLLTASMTPK